MFDHTHYVPILRWKAAEKRALAELNPAIEQRITPLIEPTPWAFDDKDPAKPKPMEQKLRKVSADIMEYWGSSPAFIDLSHVPASVRAPDGSHPFFLIAQEARDRQLELISVTGLSGERSNLEYQNAVVTISAQDGHGLCLRVTPSDISEPAFHSNLTRYLDKTEISPEHVDFLLDYGFVEGSKKDLTYLMSQIPDLDRWRSLILASGAFPVDLTKFPLGRSSLERLDWLTWETLVSNSASTRRLPTFSDYTIQHPVFREPGDFPPSASIRYAAPQHWVIMRGESVGKDDGPGFAQWPANAAMLCKQPEFCGGGFSKGDAYIETMSQQSDGAGTGNAMTWLQGTINHHITMTVRQIANQFGGEVVNAPVPAASPDQQSAPGKRTQRRAVYGAQSRRRAVVPRVRELPNAIGA